MARRSLPDAVLVARHFDDNGRLIALPVKRERRRLVLEHIARQIPPVTDLDEFTINNLLRQFTEDVASVRRQLVDEGIVARPQPGRYLRPAGWSGADQPRPA